MGIDKVQLKQEELVDNNVVLSDINPITNTNSTFDSATGMTMNETLNAIWKAINTKLSRNVNSVNGRSGVVILDSTDVGLGKVDNVSFEEIKEWVLDQLKTLFDGKHLRIYNSMDEVGSDLATNDAALDNVMFYAKTGYTAYGSVDYDDYKSYVGYFYYDDIEEILKIEYKEINVIGYTDNSIIYNESVNKTRNGITDTVDMRGGGIAINIHPLEDALILVNGASKSESGLKIDKSKLCGDFIFADSLYEAGGILARASGSSVGDPVSITLNGNEITSLSGFYLNKNRTPKLKKNDIIYTNFTRESVINGLMDTQLMSRQPAIGFVASAPSDFNPDDPWIINFVTIKPYSQQAYGIKLMTTHTNVAAENQDSILSLDMCGNETLGSLSGIQAISYQPYPNDPTTKPTINSKEMIRFVPWDIYHVTSGLAVLTDPSISVTPKYPTRPVATHGYYLDEENHEHGYGSPHVINWCDGIQNSDGELYDYIRESTIEKGPENGFAASDSYVGINFNKIISIVDDENDIRKMTNISGLKYNNSDAVLDSVMTDNDITLDSPRGQAFLKSIGIYDGKDAVGNTITFPKFAGDGGGVTINIGKFLEINPVNTVRAIDYNESGKVQVRIGAGLKEETYLERIDTDPGEAIWNAIYKECYMGSDPLDVSSIPLEFDELEEEPTDWKYGFINYWQKAVVGYLDNDAFYEDAELTTPIVVQHPRYDVFYDKITKKTYVYNDIAPHFTEPYYLSKNVYYRSPSSPDYYVQVYNTNDIPKNNTFFTDSGLTYYSSRPFTYDRIVNTLGYNVYQLKSTNRITIDFDGTNPLWINPLTNKLELNINLLLNTIIDTNSGLYHNIGNNKISYTTPEYTVGVTYPIGTIIRYNNDLYFNYKGEFTATDWAYDYTDPATGSLKKITGTIPE